MLLSCVAACLAKSVLVDALVVLGAEMTTSKSAVHVASLRRRLVGDPQIAVIFQPRIDERGTPMLCATLCFKANDWLSVAGLVAPIEKENLHYPFLTPPNFENHPNTEVASSIFG